MPSISCTKLPPKRVCTSKDRCSSRITVSPSRAVLDDGGASCVRAEVLRHGHADRAAGLLAGAEAAAARQQRESDDGEALHRTVNTTRVLPRVSGVRLPAPSIATASST